MASGHRRMPSPDNRQFVDPLRASTGSMPVNDMDQYPYYPRPAYDGYQSTRTSGRNVDPSYGAYVESRRQPRVADDRTLDAQPISSTMYRPPGQATTSRTEYAIRPRSKTSAASDRRPLSAIVPSSSNKQPIVTSGYDRSRSSRPPGYYPKDDSERYLMPASSSHGRRRRGYSAIEKNGRLAPGDNERMPRMDRGGYLTTGAEKVNKGYLMPSRDANPKDIDVYDSFSYTNPREQFYRDSDAIRDSRRENTQKKKSRPLSLTGLEAFLPPIRREAKPSGPPPSSRGFDKIGKDEPRRTHDSSDAPRASDNLRRHSSRRAPVALHQERDSASPYHQGYNEPRDGRSYSIRRDENDTVIVDDRPYHNNRDRSRNIPSHAIERERKYDDNLDMNGTSQGLATAGLASGYSKEPRGPSRGKDPIPPLEPRDARERDERSGRDREKLRSAKQWSEDDTDDHESDERGTRKYRYREGSRREPLEANTSSRKERLPKESDAEDSDSRRQRYLPPNPAKVPPGNDPTAETPVDTRDMRQLSPPNMESSSSTELELTPRGILKQPTQKFPEDPNAVREGVAPLKDTPKKGVPSGARWTKIDRRLVSPSALEGRERYEERSDYVIVLRVLTKEEIQDYAVRTADIRSRYYNSSRDRDRDWERERDPERSKGRYLEDDYRHSRRYDDKYRDDDDEYRKPLAIEASPDVRR